MINDYGNLKASIDLKTIIDYFNNNTVERILNKNQKPKIITATNVFAHIENPNLLIKLVKKIMNKNSVFITESHYLLSLIKTLQYDTIYHEHLRYYHLSSLVKLFNLNNLEVFHAKKIPTHGGSIRVYASRKGIFKKTKSFKKIIEQEKESEINKLQTFKIFKKKVIESKYKLLTMLIELRKKKKKFLLLARHQGVVL